MSYDNLAIRNLKIGQTSLHVSGTVWLRLNAESVAGVIKLPAEVKKKRGPSVFISGAAGESS